MCHRSLSGSISRRLGEAPPPTPANLVLSSKSSYAPLLLLTPTPGDPLDSP